MNFRKRLIVSFLAVIFSCQIAHSEQINIPRLAESIRKAEGNKNYGVLTGLIPDEPGHARYMCMEIIRVRLEKWDGRGDFISYLQKSYCPIGAKNDPKNLNRNWTRNVRRFYNA